MDFGEIFIKLITRTETKYYVEKRIINEESDQQILCSFISKNLNTKKVYEVQKSFEFNSNTGFFIPTYTLIEFDKPIEELYGLQKK